MCEKHRDPKIAKASSVPSVAYPWQNITADVKEVPGWIIGKRVKALIIVDPSTGLLQAKRVREETSKSLREAYVELWRRLYGAQTNRKVAMAKLGFLLCLNIFDTPFVLTNLCLDGYSGRLRVAIRDCDAETGRTSPEDGIC
jgi:hypothetical protein